jgi:hypothetical protein
LNSQSTTYKNNETAYQKYLKLVKAEIQPNSPMNSVNQNRVSTAEKSMDSIEQWSLPVNVVLFTDSTEQWSLPARVVYCFILRDHWEKHAHIYLLNNHTARYDSY